MQNRNRKHTVRRLVRAAVATACALAFVPAVVQASSHREAPAISNDPAVDNTDVYAWVKKTTRDKVYIVANYNPLQEPAGGPNFHRLSDNALYTIHVARGGTSLREKVLYVVFFETTPIKRVDPANKTAPAGGGKEFFIQLAGQKQTYSVFRLEDTTPVKVTELGTKLAVAPTNIGPRSQVFANGTGSKYDDTFAAKFIHTLKDGSRVFVGPRDDGFFVDLGGVFDLANLRKKGTAQDGVSGFNVHSIALEIPSKLLTHDGNAPAAGAGAANTLGIWAAAYRPRVLTRSGTGADVFSGDWVQVSRLGLPLINEAVIGLQDKDFFNATQPANDVTNFGAYFLNPVIVRDAEAVGIYRALGVDPTPFKFGRTDILTTISIKTASRAINTVGDVLRLDLGVDSKFPNGRSLAGGTRADQPQTDVTDVLLSVLLAKGALTISDGVDYNDRKFLTTFPFLPLPHEGYSGGHGKPTP